MQTNRELDLRLNPGGPASAVPRQWFLFVNNVLRYLKVRNGRLDVQGNKWTIIFDKPKPPVWSGNYWFAGRLNGDEPPDKSQAIKSSEIEAQGFYKQEDINGCYFGCNLRTGQVKFSDDPMDQDGVDNWEWRYVADKVKINEGTPEEDEVYILSPRTSGDIIFRDI
jgi:hypothetical protein